jgi:integral membrane sensor domain MASE1
MKIVRNNPDSRPTGEVRKVLEQIGRVLAFAALYFVVGIICTPLGQNGATGLWPPAGMALVAILLFGYRMWPGIFIGSLVVGVISHESWLTAFGVAIGETFEALVAAYLLKEVFNFKNKFTRPRDAMAFAVASFAGSAIDGAIGPYILLHAHIIATSQWRNAAIVTWFGDMMGILVFGTFLLVIFDKTAFKILKGRELEAGLILAIVFAASVLILTSNSHIPITYLLFPIVSLAAVRLTQIGVVTSVMVATLVSIWAVLSKLGPFTRMPSGEFRSIDLELYLSVLTATSLILAIAIQARMRAEETLMNRTDELDHLQKELRDANMRVTNILTGILDESSPRRGNGSSIKRPRAEQNEES